MTATRVGGEDWVLAIRLRQLGDVLASLETLRAARAARPGRRIAYVVDRPFDTILRGVDFIDRVVVSPRGGRAWPAFLRSIRALHPSAALDFHGSARSAFIALASGARVRVGFDVRGRRIAYTIREPRGEFRDGVRIPHTPIVWGTRLARHIGADAPRDVLPAIPVGEEEKEKARERLVRAGVPSSAFAGGRLVGLNPGRPVPTKRWETSRFVALARRLIASGATVVVFWGPGEDGVARAVAADAGMGAFVSPAMALAGMPGALAWMSALVTTDSGLKHLAACVRVPTVTLFGSTDPREWHMGGAHDVALWRGLSCSPCRRLHCPIGVPCLDISDEDVYHAVERVREVRA
jgi:lipopolysaccharide heptosyltransferase II